MDLYRFCETLRFKIYAHEKHDSYIKHNVLSLETKHFYRDR